VGFIPPNIINYLIKSSFVLPIIHFLPKINYFYYKKIHLQSQPTILTHINNIPIKRNFVENLPYNSALKTLAKSKRKAGIYPEVLFWLQVHKGVFHKIDFDRQRIIGNYIVDFYVKALGLIIEIDGSSHDHKVEYDSERQAYLESYGLKMYRISNADIKYNTTTTMLGLEDYIIKEFGIPL
jgi:very-short-patch-repair endonuclease